MERNKYSSRSLNFNCQSQKQRDANKEPAFYYQPYKIHQTSDSQQRALMFISLVKEDIHGT